MASRQTSQSGCPHHPHQGATQGRCAASLTYKHHSTLLNTMENNMNKGYGWYFIVVGMIGIVMAFARAKSEREVFLILATIPTAFLVVRFAAFLNKRKKE
jgi:hypothetical protein